MIEKLFFYHFFTLIIFQFFFIWEWGRANRYAMELLYISLGLLLVFTNSYNTNKKEFLEDASYIIN